MVCKKEPQNASSLVYLEESSIILQKFRTYISWKDKKNKNKIYLHTYSCATTSDEVSKGTEGQVAGLGQGTKLSEALYKKN